MPRRQRKALEADRIQIFISHASEDADIAVAVIDLLRAALNLPAEAIRCTSVDGYRLPGGASIDAQLKREVRMADAFLGIVSPASIQSIYVLFELGARWGIERHMVPLLAPGAPASLLRGPMGGLNALRADRAGELHQFVADIAKHIGSVPAKPATYQRPLDHLLGLAPREPAADKAIVTLEREKKVLEHQMKQVAPSVKRITLQCSFDELGSGEQLRRWSGIRASQPLVNCTIPYKFAASSPEGKAFWNDDLVKEIVRPRRSALVVRFEKGPKTDAKTVQGEIVIVGRLTASTGFVGFDIRQPFDKAFCMSREEVAAAYHGDDWQTEYVGFLIQVPTDSLELTIEFPRSFRNLRPRPRPIVFFSTTEKVHERETQRCEKAFSFRQRQAFLKVSNPLLGLQYAIFWMPPN